MRKCWGHPWETKFCFPKLSYEHNVTMQGRRPLSNSAIALTQHDGRVHQKQYLRCPGLETVCDRQKNVTAVGGESLQYLKHWKTCCGGVLCLGASSNTDIMFWTKQTKCYIYLFINCAFIGFLFLFAKHTRKYWHKMKITNKTALNLHCIQ